MNSRLRDLCRSIDSNPNSLQLLIAAFKKNPNTLSEIYIECHDEIFSTLQHPAIAFLILKHSPAFISKQVENNNAEMLLYHYWAMSFYYGVVKFDLKAMNDNIDEAFYYLEELAGDEPTPKYLASLINFPYLACCYLDDQANKLLAKENLKDAHDKYELALTYGCSLVNYLESLSTEIPYTLDGKGKTLSLFKKDISVSFNQLGTTSIKMGRTQEATTPYRAITTFKYSVKCFNKSLHYSSEFKLNPKDVENRKQNIAIAHASIALCHWNIQLKLEAKFMKVSISDEIYHLKCAHQYLSEITSTEDTKDILARIKNNIDAATERPSLVAKLQELETSYIQKSQNITNFISAPYQ